MYAGRRVANATTATAAGNGSANNNGGSNSGGGTIRNKSGSNSINATAGGGGATAGAQQQQTRQREQQTPQHQLFHPKLIATQIVTLQCFHYFLLSILFQINYVFYGKSVTIDRIFTDKHVRLWHTNGWADVLAIMLAAVAG